MALVHVINIVSMTANINDSIWNGDGLDLDPDASGYDFTGIDPLGIACDGQEIVICNISPTFSINLKHNNINSNEGNRLFFSDNLDKVLEPNEQVWGIRKEHVTGRVGWWLQF